MILSIHDKSRINSYVSVDVMRTDATGGFFPATLGSQSGLRFAPVGWSMAASPRKTVNVWIGPNHVYNYKHINQCIAR